MAYQKIIIQGNVGQDPELQYTKDGIAVCTISVAVNKKWTNAAGEKEERTRWYRVTCWRRLAEVVCQYVKKGSSVLVEADDIAASPYLNREGEARASLDINARDVQFLSPSGGTSNEPDFTPPPADNVEEIPF